MRAATAPKLATVRDIHTLSAEEADRAYPVRVRGVVTQAMYEWHGFAMQDPTDAVYVDISSLPHVTVKPGDLVEVEGRTGSGEFASLIDAKSVRVVRTVPLPKPRDADWKYLSSGACDNNYVSVEGVVRYAGRIDRAANAWHGNALKIDAGGNVVWAYVMDSSGLDLRRLPDSTVRVEGICVVLTTTRHQFDQTALHIQNASSVHIVRPSSGDPFAAPLTSLDRLFLFRPAADEIHRVRVQGAVTYVHGQTVTIQDSQGRGLLVQRIDNSPLRVADGVEAVGFAPTAQAQPMLGDALIRRTGSTQAVTPQQTSASDILKLSTQVHPRTPQARLVQLDGALLYVTRSMNDEVMALRDKNVVFTARLISGGNGDSLSNIAAGSKVRVTGVCMMEVTTLVFPTTFELLLRGRQDVVTLQRPSWLTVPVVLRGGEIVMTFAVAAFVWVALLRRRVAIQTRTIRQQVQRESELARRLQDLVENASDMVYIRDLEGRFIHVNHGAQIVTGYSPAELLKLRFDDLVAPHERYDARRRMLTQEGKSGAEYDQAQWTVLARDGAEVRLEVKERLLHQEDGTTVVEGIGRDISEHVRTIADQEERFRNLADNIPQMAWMADATGHRLWFNKRAYEYTGAGEGELLGFNFRAWHHPDEIERVKARLKYSLETGEPWEDTFPIRGRDGQYRWFLGKAVAIRDAKGNIVRWFGTNTDITDQKITETELQRANEELREFAYVASHDLQEPIRNVCAFTEMLMRTFKDGDLTPQRSQYMKIVTDGAKRMEALIRDLLSYTRATSGDPQQYVQFELDSALDFALENLKLSIQESGVSISRDRLPMVFGAEAQIAQVLQNLVGNAIKYRRTGIALEVKIGAKRQGREWLIWVKDNGLGFDPKYAANIFGIFKRLHGGEIPGTGIGLAICRTIVERHGGRIWAEGAENHGATFYFTLPASEQPVQQEAPELLDTADAHR